jgi:hypothetical protein
LAIPFRPHGSSALSISFRPHGSSALAVFLATKSSIFFWIPWMVVSN